MLLSWVPGRGTQLECMIMLISVLIILSPLTWLLKLYLSILHSPSIYITSALKYLSEAWHFLRQIYPDFDCNRAHPFVQVTINRSKKIHMDPIHHKLPVCPAHLSNFHQVALSSGKYDDLLFITILSCCFYNCHRSGKLILKNSKDEFDWHKIIKYGSLILDTNCVSYHQVPYHKSDHFYQGTDTLLKLYVHLCDRIHGACAALFICEDGSLCWAGICLTMVAVC